MCYPTVALDPGNSTGWVIRKDINANIVGGTIGESHKDVWRLLDTFKPKTVVFETFQMYPNKAQKLIWNTFYPCEVIGVIKLWCQCNHIDIIGIQPALKKYALGNSELDLWKTVEVLPSWGNVTEHTRDAVRLLRYYERNKKPTQ